jgi:hypothetical protein
MSATPEADRPRDLLADALLRARAFIDQGDARQKLQIISLLATIDEALLEVSRDRLAERVRAALPLHGAHNEVLRDDAGFYRGCIACRIEEALSSLSEQEGNG